MDELVRRLLEGDHPIVANRYKCAEELKQAIDRGFVLVRFTDTQGGTELCLRPDQGLTNLSSADFGKSMGTAHLVGNLTLNQVKVRSVVDVALATLDGQGHLELRE